ncbi:MAG: hypothetical protein FJ271_26270 [Planctomycetes bacterium]|nr:hypothetical protein [Planctomycetota bacterium]
MAAMTTACNLGFLTILQESSGHLGGFLVTNQWGRPLEFRLSTAVQPNRVQQILYGPTLATYLCAEVIGKALVDKTVARPQFILTDIEAALELRHHVPVPVVWLGEASRGDERPESPRLTTHPHYLEDADMVAEWLERQGKGLDLAEPFIRIRDALAEARKMGATNRG